jgi:drug/metabolite transporter (DMT)-like permease
MAILLGLTAAVCWGVADFVARATSKRVGSYLTSFYLQLVGFTALSLGMIAAGGFGFLSRVHAWQPWAWAVLTGVMNAALSLMLYHSFEIGVLAVVAPIASSYSVLTVGLSLLSGERLSVIRGVGIVAAIVGVALAATSSVPSPGQATGWRAMHPRHMLASGVLWAIFSAIGYGVMFWLFGYRVVPVFGGFASVWIARGVTFTALLLGSLLTRRSIRVPNVGGIWWLLLALGLMDTGAFVANNLGLQTGHVGIVTVLSSLFAAVTVLMGYFFLRERLERSQWFGVLLIFAAIGLVSL